MLKTPKKEPKKEIVFKELVGSLQKEALFYLAENPDNCKQAILKGIQHPLDQRSAVKNAVNALEKQGYIKSKKALSQKQVKINKYYCNELGVFYALTRNPKPDIPKILDAYKNQIEFCKSFQGIYNIMGHDPFADFLKNIREILPMIQKDGFNPTNQFIMYMKMTEIMKNLNQETRQKYIEEALRQFPQSKKLVAQYQNTINEMARALNQANIQSNE